MQVLKEEIRVRILTAAETVFYQKDYRSAKLKDIATIANIPVALIYSYFKNKACLFDAVVNAIYLNFETALNKEEASAGGAQQRFEDVGEKYIKKLLIHHKKFVILMDKSAGTQHVNAKTTMIMQLQKHIEIGLKRQTKEHYDPMLAHILASNFTEGILEIARHYQGETWASTMLKLITKCYFTGVESL